MEGLAELLGFGWLDSEQGDGCVEVVRGTEFDHISNQDLRLLVEIIRRKSGEAIALAEKYEELAARVQSEENSEKKKELEELRKKAKSELDLFAVPVDTLLGAVNLTTPAALARATIGGLEVLVPVDRSDTPYRLLEGAMHFSKPKGPFDARSLHNLADAANGLYKVIEHFTTPYEKREKGTQLGVQLHLTHHQRGYITGGEVMRQFAAGGIAQVVITYNFAVLEHNFTIPGAETSIEISFQGEQRGVRHVYKCNFTHTPENHFPYQLERVLGIKNLGSRDRFRQTETKIVNDASEVKRYAALLASAVALITERNRLGKQIREIAATYQGPFADELLEFGYQGIKLGPEGYLVPERGFFRRLLGL